MKKILIVDDDAELRTNLSEVLAAAGYLTQEAASAKEAARKAAGAQVDLVLLDFMMPKMTGIDALLDLKRNHPAAKVIMMTAFATVENAVDAIKKGASDYISKPFKVNSLLTVIRRVLEEARFEENLKRMDFDNTFSSLANPIRRNILKMLSARSGMRLMEITRELEIEDHTKVVFHLKILRESGIIEQDDEKSYSLTREGMRTMDCLKTVENFIGKQQS